MNNAQLTGMRLSHEDHKIGAAYDASRLTITKSTDGWEARRGGKLVGVTATREGAKELLSAL